jgi:hypothetical protein
VEAFELATGRVRWTVPVAGPCDRLQVAGDTVVCWDDHHVELLRRADGARRAVVEAKGWTSPAPSWAKESWPSATIAGLLAHRGGIVVLTPHAHGVHESPDDGVLRVLSTREGAETAGSVKKKAVGFAAGNRQALLFALASGDGYATLVTDLSRGTHTVTLERYEKGRARGGYKRVLPTEETPGGARLPDRQLGLLQATGHHLLLGRHGGDVRVIVALAPRLVVKRLSVVANTLLESADGRLLGLLASGVPGNGDDPGRLQRLSATTGEPLWTATHRARGSGMRGERVIVADYHPGSMGCGLAAFALADGTVWWKASPEAVDAKAAWSA